MAIFFLCQTSSQMYTYFYVMMSIYHEHVKVATCYLFLMHFQVGPTALLLPPFLEYKIEDERPLFGS